MMHTAHIFEMAGQCRQARAIERNGTDWLRLHRVMVESWASDIGLDISTEIAIDTATYQPTPPPMPFNVDVILPFCSTDSHFVAECLLALDQQLSVRPVVHLVADACQWPDMIAPFQRLRVRCYSTDQPRGPYRIANSIVRYGHAKTPWLAIQDADDISLPDRLWRQISTLIALQADMISSVTENYIDEATPDDPWLLRQLAYERTVRPGRVYDSAPKGRCVNTLRTMRRELFEQMNGFCDLHCSADFEFDNRCRFLGVPIIDDQTQLGRRRLHLGSLTNGSYRLGSPQRATDNAVVNSSLNAIRNSPTIATAATIGGLNRAIPLKQIEGFSFGVHKKTTHTALTLSES